MNVNDDFEQLKSEASDHYQAYVDYSKLLRVWLVAYGIGAPILFITNDALWQTIAKSELAWLIAVMFLAGVFAQVFVAWLNKTTQWIIFSGKNKPSHPPSWLFATARKIGRQFWIDVAADLASILLFTVATGWLFRLLLVGH
jgi:hypothetical protein